MKLDGTTLSYVESTSTVAASTVATAAINGTALTSIQPSASACVGKCPVLTTEDGAAAVQALLKLGPQATIILDQSCS